MAHSPLFDAVVNPHEILVYALVLGISVLLGLIAINRLPKYRWLGASILLFIITVVALPGFWFSPGKWGISDWDYYFSLHTEWRQTMLTFHQFPLWNPYTCGGTSGLGDPEFSVLTPSYLLELIFGVPIGFRLAIYFMTFIGGAGMLMLARRLRLSPTAGFLVAIVYSLGTCNLLEIVEGHPNIFSAGWIPWIFWAWLAAYRRKDKLTWRPNCDVLLCAIFLALTFYQGGIYVLMYCTLAFILLPWLTSQPWKAYKTTIIAGAWALGLAAFKLIPVFYWLKEFQDSAYASPAFTLPWLYQILAGRYIHGAEVIPNQGGGWHEYGAYVGGAVLLLALLGALFSFKKRVGRGLVIACILALLLSSMGPYLKPLFDHMDFFPRSNITRFILFAVIPISLLAGFCLEFIRERLPRLSIWLLPIIVAFVAFDLIGLDYPLSNQAFVLPEVLPPVKQAPWPIAFTTDTYKVRAIKNDKDSEDYTRAYAAVLSGYGTLSYCSVLSPDPAVRTIYDEVDNGEVLTTNRQSQWQLTKWSPNTVQLTLSTPGDTNVILNTNYAKGWSVNGKPAKEIDGRVGTTLPAGEYILVFSYKTPGLVPGAVVTVLTIVILLFGLYKHERSTRI